MNVGARQSLAKTLLRPCRSVRDYLETITSFPREPSSNRYMSRRAGFYVLFYKMFFRNGGNAGWVRTYLQFIVVLQQLGACSVLLEIPFSIGISTTGVRQSHRPSPRTLNLISKGLTHKCGYAHSICVHTPQRLGRIDNSSGGEAVRLPMNWTFPPTSSSDNGG